MSAKRMVNALHDIARSVGKTRTDRPCACWSGPTTLHEGHCCIADAPDDVVTFEGLPCGHGAEAKAMHDAWKASQ
ncbi:hypothetical protein [Janibacter terrae]|uniref:hypothetical protein n=1 Tax=Janibacter terrae TaxID=103817 RepID=UPI0031F90867